MDECDFWVVIEDLPDIQTTKCPPANTIFIASEPPSVKSYEAVFTNQFASIITCNRLIKGPNVIYSHSSLPWHVGRRSKNHQNLGFTQNYDELHEMKSFEKNRLISVITSDKTFTRGHRNRIRLVKQLKQHFGSTLDLFGRGINEIENKWDAIIRYKYHIALENCSYPDYWTEKVGDAYLGGAVPIYYGCPNLEEYFPKNSFFSITTHVDEAISTIERVISEDPYEAMLQDVMNARSLVLDHYNLFPRLHELVNRSGPSGPRECITLKPAEVCSSTFAKARNKLTGIIHRVY